MTFWEICVFAAKLDYRLDMNLISAISIYIYICALGSIMITHVYTSSVMHLNLSA